jgi:hypothetical protein
MALTSHLQKPVPVYPPIHVERYHAGDRIGTGFVESTVNQAIS